MPDSATRTACTTVCELRNRQGVPCTTPSRPLPSWGLPAMPALLVTAQLRTLPGGHSLAWMLPDTTRNW